MPDNKIRTGSELFIVDNSDTDWKVKNYLHDWTDLSNSFDIATGYFEIGALLALDGQWQKLEKLRILMGDEVSKRTRKALIDGIQHAVRILDASIEREKENNDFLTGVPAIVEALQKRQIECRIYTKEKFHAKAYITHARQAVIGSAALVGSSNFTAPGLTNNVELNIQVRREVELLQEWYERHWQEANDITPDILRVIERHTREYRPFDVYAKALTEFFKGHEMTADEWDLASPERGGSLMYPILDEYQKEGYRALMKIAQQFDGAFLCDGVGLGKTFIGMMLIERLIVHDRKRVMLLVPKATREPVWESALDKYLPNIRGGFMNLRIFNHSDLLRGGRYPHELKQMKDQADVIVIDEAHHFRNPGTLNKTHYWKLYEIAEGKTIFFLTATPINNGLLDLQHMIELFTRRKPNYFAGAPLGIHSLPGHFRKMENVLEKMIGGEDDGQESFNFRNIDQSEASQVLWSDALFRSLVVQRSRAYVKASQLQHNGNRAIFPVREDPKVANYSVHKTYGNLLDMIDTAFSKEKPLFSLAFYSPLSYYRGPMDEIDSWVAGRQTQIVSLIRIQFLKRFESSPRAFEMSCWTLLQKLMAWVEKNSEVESEKRRFERWKNQNAELIGQVREKQMELFGSEVPEELDEDFITEEMLEDIERLPRDKFKVEEILAESFLDLDQIAEFLNEMKKFKISHDDKLRALIQLLKTDPILKKHKVLIFSEYLATARYLKKQLAEAGITGIDEVDSASKRDRGDIIRQFAPYYNDSSSQELGDTGLEETRVLVATDVLSEGLNLQDATRLINYDLHWNPVRLMQRIGRIDRRMNPDIEQKITTDHPDQKPIRGTAAYWNFLPPDDLDKLLTLYGKVAHKTLRISKTFGIEGKKLLKPDDDYDALRDFIHQYEGSATTSEVMHLEYQNLLKQIPGLQEQVDCLPGRVFSGKAHIKPGSKGIFFCYALPAPPAQASASGLGEEVAAWSEEAGITQWYLYDFSKDVIIDDASEIIDYIRCTPDIVRQCSLTQRTLSDIRTKIEKHIKNTYFKRVQAPVGVRATLKCWMELG